MVPRVAPRRGDTAGSGAWEVLLGFPWRLFWWTEPRRFNVRAASEPPRRGRAAADAVRAGGRAPRPPAARRPAREPREGHRGVRRARGRRAATGGCRPVIRLGDRRLPRQGERSEERRVGKECRCRWGRENGER